MSAGLDPDAALADLDVARPGVDIACGQVDRTLRKADNARALQVSARPTPDTPS